MKSPRSRAHALIHVAAAAAAGVGAGLAQFPGADAPVLMGIQATTVAALADIRGAPSPQMVAAEVLSTLGATLTGRTASQALVGWLPGYGNAINAATAAAVTEAVGWAAWEWLEQSR